MDRDLDPVTTPLVVVNPMAARLHDPTRRAELLEAVVRAVRARTGLEPRIAAGTMAEADTALEASTRSPLVVAVGGDGTIRQAARWLAGSATPVAVVPGGTGNVLAASLGIRGIKPALIAIRHGRPRTIDLGEARVAEPTVAGPVVSSVFLVACGMGLDARIMAAAEHEWKRRMRFGAYLGAAVRALSRLEAVDFRIEADGAILERRAYLVLIANAGELIPGRVGPRRPIDPSDGLLDLIVVNAHDPITSLHGASRLLVEAGDIDDVVIRRPVRHVRVDAAVAEPIEIDGDALPPGTLEATVRPAALTLLGAVL